ncbi:MAG: fluoride efflux transporter CrcB [Clostridiales bacterium]|nr:fluoride efflux transporter CrcB [Clostridiales bacterium]
MLKNIIYVGIGGFFGSTARYILSRLMNTHFPYGTLFVNSLGSFLIGFLTYKFLKSSSIPQEYILLFTTGFIGAFTTFSTYMLESYILVSNDQVITGIINIFLNLLLGFILVFLGFQLAKSI